MRNVTKSRTLLIIMAIYMLFTTSLTAYASGAEKAAGLPDYTQKGSVTVDILSTDTGRAVPGGVLTLYEVADAGAVEGGNVYELTGAFKNSGIALDNVNESDAGMKELASRLETYVNRNKIKGNAVTVDAKGQAKWSDLQLGLYLVVHTTPAKGYDPMNAFLVSVPRYLDGAYVYDVKAAPKAGTVNSSVQKIPEPTQKPDAGGKLPQTGQLWWPVPILAFTGILFVMLGWYRRRCCGKSDDAHE